MSRTQNVTKYELADQLARETTKKREGDFTLISSKALDSLVLLASYAPAAEIQRLSRQVRAR